MTELRRIINDTEFDETPFLFRSSNRTFYISVEQGASFVHGPARIDKSVSAEAFYLRAGGSMSTRPSGLGTAIEGSGGLSFNVDFGSISFNDNRIQNVGAPVIGTDAARLQDIGPGFYGIKVGETDDTPLFSGITILKFNSTDFYVEQNVPNTDTAIVNFRGTTSSSGEANTASNLGAGEGIFAQKVGVDLQFKSLVAGSEISLSSTSTEITINSTSGPGFYGVVVKEDSTVIARTDSLQFEADDFDLTTQDGDVRIAI